MRPVLGRIEGPLSWMILQGDAALSYSNGMAWFAAVERADRSANSDRYTPTCDPAGLVGHAVDPAVVDAVVYSSLYASKSSITVHTPWLAKPPTAPSTVPFSPTSSTLQ